MVALEALYLRTDSGTMDSVHATDATVVGVTLEAMGVAMPATDAAMEGMDVEGTDAEGMDAEGMDAEGMDAEA